jgi:hypothetical protein
VATKGISISGTGAVFGPFQTGSWNRHSRAYVGPALPGSDHRLSGADPMNRAAAQLTGDAGCSASARQTYPSTLLQTRRWGAGDVRRLPDMSLHRLVAIVSPTSEMRAWSSSHSRCVRKPPPIAAAWIAAEPGHLTTEASEAAGLQRSVPHATAASQGGTVLALSRALSWRRTRAKH